MRRNSIGGSLITVKRGDLATFVNWSSRGTGKVTAVDGRTVWITIATITESHGKAPIVGTTTTFRDDEIIDRRKGNN